MPHRAEFEAIVSAIVARMFAQKAQPLPPADHIARFAAQLRQLVADRGLPRPLGPEELGAPGGLSDEECAPLVARVLAGLDPAPFGDVARQLVKACFYPEFKVCRDSFREVARDGSCRRQELARVRSRVSGTHCVDCPHWVALEPAEHEAYLVREWRGDPAAFLGERGIFLPEDFRVLRRWLYRAAREGVT